MSTDTPRDSSETLLTLARRGEAAAIQGLFLRYRSYLLALARPQIHRRLQGKVDASDLAQEAMLEAHRCFGQFRGANNAEFAAWLRSILAHRVARHVRHYLRVKGRDAALERSLTEELDNASSILDRGLVDHEDSPSEVAVARESNLRLADSLESLPEDYREVIFLRHFEGMTFAEVAESMQRSVDSVEKLWMRALVRLRRNVKESHA